MSNHLDTRLKDALQAAADTIPDALARPRVEARLWHPSYRPPWPVVAIVAAVAVALAVAIPYALLRGTSSRPLPAQTPTTVDPPPLRAVELKAVGKYFLEPDIRVPPDAPGVKMLVGGTGATSKRPVLPGMVYTSATIAPDYETFYVARNRGDAQCTADVHKLELADDGSIESLVLVPGTQAAGLRYEDLQVSPNGRALAMTVQKQAPNGHFCQPDNVQPDVAIVDLTTGSRRTWPNGMDEHDPWTSGGFLTWSFDGKSLVFPWPVHPLSIEGSTDLRVLDVTTPEGPLESASKPIPHDKDFLATGRIKIAPVTAGTREFAAFQPQGGRRILAMAEYPMEWLEPGEKRTGRPHPPLPGTQSGGRADPTRPRPGMVEISLATGKIRDLPR